MTPRAPAGEGRGLAGAVASPARADARIPPPGTQTGFGRRPLYASRLSGWVLSGRSIGTPLLFRYPVTPPSEGFRGTFTPGPTGPAHTPLEESPCPTTPS